MEKKISIIRCTILLLVSVETLADTGSFEQQCAGLAREAKVEVLYRDIQITRNDRLSIQQLKRMSNFSANPFHNILGVTHAEPEVSLESNARILMAMDGSACAAPSLTVRLGFKSLTVYLAHDVPGDCRRRIVEAHELEHVAVWRDHYRAGARLMQTRLQALLGKTFHAADKDALESEMKSRVEGEVANMLTALYEGAIEANRHIDSPTSYQRAANQMRGCR
ncbi:MAG: hypothetical protein AB1443_10255 [Pseudomonadota bacterium]